MLFPLMILLYLKKIINSLESSTPKKNLYFSRLVVIISVFFKKLSAVSEKCPIANIILSQKGIVFPKKGLPLFNRTESTGEK